MHQAFRIVDPLKALEYRCKEFHIGEVTDLLRDFALRLNKIGSTYSAACPFHRDEGDYPYKKRPSFKVSLKNNVAHCFSCGVTGGPLTLPLKMLSLERTLFYLGDKLPFNPRDDKQKELVVAHIEEELQRISRLRESLHSYFGYTANLILPSHLKGSLLFTSLSS